MWAKKSCGFRSFSKKLFLSGELKDWWELAGKGKVGVDRNSVQGQTVLSQSRGEKQQSLFRIQEEFREAGSANDGSWGIVYISYQRAGKVHHRICRQ